MPHTYQPGADSQACPSHGTVAIIEDDEVLLVLTTELLVAEGFRVVSHSRADDAHVVVRNCLPDVLLLELRLGQGADAAEAGWRVLDRLILDPATRDIPVLIETGDASSVETRRAALELGHPVRVLLKPFDVDQLLDAVTEVLELRGRRFVRPSLGSASPVSRLTGRQREIVQLIAFGLSNREIAQRLVLEQGTVANHVAHVLERLGLTNRAQVAAWAVLHGVIGPAEVAEDSVRVA